MNGIAALPAVSVPMPVPGARSNYWFLRLRVHDETLTCNKATFCAALSAEGLPITERYDAALPHEMEWFKQRCVFDGASGLPWTGLQSVNDPERRFSCPNAIKALDTGFNLHCHEHWDQRDVGDALAILAKVSAAYARC